MGAIKTVINMVIGRHLAGRLDDLNYHCISGNVGTSNAVKWGTLRENVFLRDNAITNIDPLDGKHIEIVAMGLPVAHGIPITVDATIVSPFTQMGPYGQGPQTLQGTVSGEHNGVSTKLILNWLIIQLLNL